MWPGLWAHRDRLAKRVLSVRKGPPVKPVLLVPKGLLVWLVLPVHKVP